VNLNTVATDRHTLTDCTDGKSSELICKY